MAAEKYRKLFPYYEYKFLDAVSCAVTACNLFVKLICKRYMSIQGVEMSLLTCRLVTEKVFATLCIPEFVTVYAVLLPKNTEVSY